ncbi:MAG: DUF6512 family protein [Lachnospiraceae bacterium]|nr:DUF6512 family protein [Lachnospiraceae bacterium]
MKKSIPYSTIVGILFVSILGVLMHFVYEWSSSNRFVGLFSPINESTWEHMKLLFFPMLLYGFLESLIVPSSTSKKAATGVGILVGTALIPILFYTYSGILGYNIPALDISIFFVSVLAAFFIRHRCILSGKCEKYALPVLILIMLWWAVFFLFTYMPPSLGIFAPPS